VILLGLQLAEGVEADPRTCRGDSEVLEIVFREFGQSPHVRGWFFGKKGLIATNLKNNG